MSFKWILFIIIALGFISLFLNQRGSGLSLSLSTPGISNFGSSERIDTSLDTNRDGVIDESERRDADIRRIEAEIEQIQKEIERAQEELLASPYKDKVTLSQGNASSRKLRSEYVAIRANTRNTEKIDITGWRLISPISNNWAVLGKGTLVPIVGGVNKKQPILLSPGETAIVATPFSTIGVSFHTNICTGYFEQHQNFSPRIKRECPEPGSENLEQFGINQNDDACINYIDRLPRCEIVHSSSTLSDECGGYIRTYLNYNGCVALHEDDPDFLGNEWRIFMRSSELLWRKDREVIKLLDSDRKVVDVITY